MKTFIFWYLVFLSFVSGVLFDKEIMASVFLTGSLVIIALDKQ
jgi:hypothetical protein